jgi:hypothetical protein
MEYMDSPVEIWTKKQKSPQRSENIITPKRKVSPFLLGTCASFIPQKAPGWQPKKNIVT